MGLDLKILLLLFAFEISRVLPNHQIEDQTYWFDVGNADIKQALKIERNKNLAKNVILFVGDGLGLSTLTAARIYDKTEKGYFSFEKFSNVGLLKTYSADKIVPDSSSTATALFCGVKGNQKTCGLDNKVNEGDCLASLNPASQTDSLIKWAQEKEKATGFVTTTRVTHATPCALYAHSPSRSWECESKIPSTASYCQDIATQLIKNSPGKYINVIMGGGRQCLQSNVRNRSNDPIDTWACYSKDGRDLIKDWTDEKYKQGKTHAYISNNEELENLPDVDYVLGIFANGHLKMEHERDQSPKGMPSITNMTASAIKTLRRNKNGFVLMVEGGMIDFAHHRGHAKQALNEVAAFNQAVEKAIELTKDIADETLIIVTSDHSHSLLISGYASRGSKITGIAQNSKMNNVSYTTLLYGTGGPNNYKYSIENNSILREDPSMVNTDHFNYSQQAAILNDEVTHEGTDVVVYAKGPMAHLFYSVHEQTYVANVIAYAAHIGPYKHLNDNSSELIKVNNYVLISTLILLLLFETLGVIIE